MTYVSGDGQVLKSKPWGISSIFGFFSGIIYGVAMFFQTLFNPSATRYGDGYTRSYRPGSGPPRPPTSKKIHGLNLKPPSNVPGGCTSCQG